MQKENLRPEDLMVGDWVLLFDKKHAKVDCIGNVEVYLSEPNGQDWRVTYEHIKPIPLTQENFRSIGFKDIDHDGDCDGSDIYWLNGDGYSINTQDLHLHYVHELQHALKLCGINKTIVL